MRDGAWLAVFPFNGCATVLHFLKWMKKDNIYASTEAKSLSFNDLPWHWNHRLCYEMIIADHSPCQWV